MQTSDGGLKMPQYELAQAGTEQKTEGGADCFREQIIALLPRLSVFAYCLTGNAEQRDDLVQETCTRFSVQGSVATGHAFEQLDVSQQPLVRSHACKEVSERNRGYRGGRLSGGQRRVGSRGE